MADAPLPESLPGLFFLIEYDRDDQTYAIHLDDEDYTSYELGDVQQAMRQFELWAFVADDGTALLNAAHLALDIAHEFGAAIAVPTEKPPRVWAHYDRTPVTIRLNEGEQRVVQLPDISNAS